MQTGTWHRRGSTIELHEGDLHEGAPPASVSGEEDELLSSLFSSALSGARQGSDYLRSRFRAPAPTPVSPPSTRAPRAVSATRFPVPESALTSLLPAFAEYRYDFSAGRYPWKLPGVSLPLAPPKQTNCCIFAESLLCRAWSDTHGAAFSWNGQRHAQMMIMSAKDLSSPVSAMVDAEMGIRLREGEPPTAWCLAQGWRSATSGHTFIIVARHAPSDRVLILEANKAYGLDGVGYRNLGNLRDFLGSRPPARWWENSAAPRWSDVRRTYSQSLALAKLNVTGAQWAGLPSS